MRNRVRNTVAGVVAAGVVAVGGLTACGGGGTMSPSAQLEHDGYGAVLVLSNDQLAQMAGDGTSVSEVSPYLVSSAVGYRSASTEVVMQLTDEGAQLVAPHVAELSDGTATARMDGNNLVVDQ